MSSVRAFFVIVAALFSAPAAFGYANFIAYGYRSCTTCHYNPLGNGPLNDYGRATWATHIAAKPFFLPHATDEELADASGVLGPVKLPFWFRPSFDYRGLALFNDLFRNTYPKWMTMRADAAIVLRADPENRLFVSARGGYVDDPTGKNRHWISREYYVGWRPADALGLYAGFMDVAFGLRIPDHIAYSRMRALLDQNDQTHGVLANYIEKNFEASLHVFVGNLLSDASVRQKGASVTGELEVSENNAVGASLLYSVGDVRNRGLASVHYRRRTGEASSLIAELGLILDDRKLMGERSYGTYLFSQYHWRLRRGLILLPTLEYYTPRIFAGDIQRIRLGPGIQWFPFQRLELRADLSGIFQLGARSDMFLMNLYWQLHVAL